MEVTDHASFRCTRDHTRPSCPCPCHTFSDPNYHPDATCAQRAVARDFELDLEYRQHRRSLADAPQDGQAREHTVEVRTPQGRTRRVVRPW